MESWRKPMTTSAARFATAVLGLLGAFGTNLATAEEPTAAAVRNDPMYMAVFGGANPVASIRTPVEGSGQLAGSIEEWPEIAEQWHPRSVPMTPDPSR
jgi:hypothetical protein